MRNIVGNINGFTMQCIMFKTIQQSVTLKIQQYFSNQTQFDFGSPIFPYFWGAFLNIVIFAIETESLF